MTLEDCERNVPKRASKLENFLRKKLPLADLSALRYYEVCVLESKGALLVRYIILTENSILMTENPPKNLSFITRISQIRDINLVADRGSSLITGSQGKTPFICRHIQIVYEEECSGGRGKEKGGSKTMTPTPRHHHHHHHSDEGRGSSASSSSCGSNEEISSSRFSSVTEISLVDELNHHHQHKSLPIKIPSFLRQAYDPFVDYSHPHPPPPPSLPLPSSSSASATSSIIDSGFSSEDFILSMKRRGGGGGENCKLENGGGSTTSKSTTSMPMPMPTIIRTRSSTNSTFSSSSSSSSEKDDCDIESLSTSISIEHGDDADLVSTNSNNNNLMVMGGGNENYHHHHQQQQQQQRASSALDESKRVSEQQELKERPQSIDISQLASLRNKFIPTYFKRMGGGKSPSKSTSSSPNHNNNNNNNNDATSYSSSTLVVGHDDDGSIDELPTFKILELNFYLYQQPSSLLNELYLVWNRNQSAFAMNGVEKNNNNHFVMSDAEENEQVYSLRAAEKIMKSLSQQKVFMDPHYFSKFDQLLPPLCALQQGLVKYHHLRRLTWKNTSLTRDLVEMVKHTINPEEEREEEEDGSDKEEEESETQFLVRVNVFSVLMDIFRLLYESCNTSFLLQNSSDRNSPSSTHLNHTMTTTTLVRVLFSDPTVVLTTKIPGRRKILRVICDPQTFAKLDWMDSQDSDVIKVLCVAHNASAALLYEILTLTHFSRRDNEKMTFWSGALNAYSKESYVKQSVTQIINLLWSSRQPLTASQGALLYRHVYVLKTLMDNLQTVRTFVRISFCEEFQYFIHRNCINTKLSDRYPIKPKLVLIFDQLRRDIMEKE